MEKNEIKLLKTVSPYPTNNWSFWTEQSSVQSQRKSRGTWTILPQQAAEFCKPARGIWPSSSLKTVPCWSLQLPYRCQAWLLFALVSGYRWIT